MIEDLSPLGARVRAAAGARTGAVLTLELLGVNGRRERLRGAVRSVRRTTDGTVLGCSFERDAESCVGAWRLVERLRRGSGRFVAPANSARRPGPPRFELSLTTFVLLGAGIIGLLLGAFAALVRAMVG
jgi:hypothetical protein